MRRLLNLGLVLSMGLVIGVAAPATAACHAFAVSVDADEVVEGESVEVTVTRDAAVADSQVDVNTVDGTATAGVDYESLDDTATFPDNGTSQVFTVETLAVSGANGSRTFDVEVSNGSGCSVNPNFTYGDPVTVTITDAAEEDPTDDPTDEPTDDPTEESTDGDVASGDDLPDTGSRDLLVLASIGLLAVLVGTLSMRRRANG
jgi:LPXTG-motif cell wall-anchored protein